MAVITITMFIIAPNLFTNMASVIDVIKAESRDRHVGADGLGILGNIKYYISVFLKNSGYLIAVPLLTGCVYAVISKKTQMILLIPNFLFWLGLSIMPLHWERWGTPVYFGFMIIAAIGMSALWEIIFCINNKYRNIYKTGLIIISFILLTNNLLNSIIVMKVFLMKDARVQAMSFCEANGITKYNSMFEAYTPLETSNENGCFIINDLKMDNGKIQAYGENIGKKYYVMSSSMMNRYMLEKESYQEEVTLYNSLINTKKLVYNIEAKNYVVSGSILKNIPKALKYLFDGEKKYTGNNISIYDLGQEVIKIKPNNSTQKYLSIEKFLPGELVFLGDNANNNWIKVNIEDNSFILISLNSGLALDVTGGKFENGVLIEQWNVTGKIPQQWKFQKCNDGYNILSEENMALTYNLRTGKIFLEKLDMKNLCQVWEIEEID